MLLNITMALVIDKDYNIFDARTGTQITTDIYYCERLVYTLDMLKNKYPNNKYINNISENGLFGIYVQRNYWLFIYNNNITIVQVPQNNYHCGLDVITSNLTIPEELCTKKYNNKMFYKKCMFAYVESNEIVVHSNDKITKYTIPEHDIFVDINSFSYTPEVIFIKENKAIVHPFAEDRDESELELVNKENYSYILWHDEIKYIIKDGEVYYTKLTDGQLVDVVGNLLFVGSNGKLYYADEFDTTELVELDEKYSPYIPHELQIKSARKN